MASSGEKDIRRMDRALVFSFYISALCINSSLFNIRRYILCYMFQRDISCCGGFVTAMAPIFIVHYGVWYAILFSLVIMLIFLAISVFSGWTKVIKRS
ncbi:MAG TPA: hypothetical protein DD381_12310 [Lentisphaeria bacterium]|nr:MAG: hypothetical protein A2X47_09425 [Lentisphaerae bacterium GWF2_38_69]HBM17109.1 hypothetical protein [Lentisphaeria bacterium]